MAIKGGWLNMRVRKEDRRAVKEAVRHGTPGALEQLRKAGDQEVDFLAELIEATEDLLDQLEVPLPGSEDDLAAWASPAIYPDGAGKDAKTLEEFAAATLPSFPEVALQADKLAMVAYVTFRKAKDLTDKAQHERATQLVALGAVSLSQACSAFAWQAPRSAAGKAKTTKNPKAAAIAAAKVAAKSLWDEKRAGLHPNLRGHEHFAIEACRRWPVLESIGTVVAWSQRWEKEARATDRAAP